MDQYEGKVAFITGGASGVGFGMAKTFLQAGMKVAIADIRQDHLDKALTELGNQPVHGIRLDVTDRKAFAAAADEAERVFGHVSVVCNNAGVLQFASLDNCTYADWDWELGVNLGGVINGVQTFVPRLKQRAQGGHIVNTASMAGFISSAAAGVYAASKFGVRGLTEALRWALAPYGIRVSMVNPGLVNSAIYDSGKTRPESLASETGDTRRMAKMAETFKDGMAPEEMGQKILAGMRRNDLFIFTHSEFKEELKEILDDVLASVPDGQAPPARQAFQDNLRKTKAEARAKAKAI